MQSTFDYVFIGLAITSSWGNGHATTYRSLLKGLHSAGKRVLFLERDRPWYADNRDAPSLPYCTTALYSSMEELKTHASVIRSAEAVVVGSYVEEGSVVSRWVLDEARGVRAFYDIDTPVTLACLATNSCSYLRVEHIPEFDVLLSFTGGPTLQKLQEEYGAQRAVPLYCSVDTDSYRPLDVSRSIDLGYMGTYSLDRQPGVDALLNQVARRLPDRSFVVAGAQYPESLQWPANVRRISHIPPSRHAEFYCTQHFTLNVTRQDMRAAGYSPSVRLFEAAACGTPIISDEWVGLDEVLTPGSEVIVARETQDVVSALCDTSDAQRQRIAKLARQKILDAHSGAQRARQLIECVERCGSATAPTHVRRPQEPLPATAALRG